MICFANLLRNTSGNTTVLFALAAVPLLLVGASAIDMVHANRTQAVLQGAADAAALAGGVSDVSEGDAKKLVEDFVIANGAQNALDSDFDVKITDDKNTGSFQVKISGKINTSFMKLAGISTMDIDAMAEVMRGSRALEVVLVLDNTDSMNFEGRLDSLKVASRQLVDDIFENTPNKAYTKIGIVPFANYVNVGLGSRGKAWMSVPADSSNTTNECWATYPSATKSNCHMEPYNYVQDGVSVSTTTEVCDWNYGAPVNQCGPVNHDVKWYGCVGSRNSPLDRSIGSEAVPYPGVMDTYCPRPITDLSDDKSELQGEIDAMTATGNTYIPAGLLWGWNMLNPAEPLSSAKSKVDMAGLEGVKALVLMTDGANTLVPAYPNHVDGPAATSDAIVSELCGNIKADGIIIYTVSFKVTDSVAQKNLTDCASDPSKAFDADDATELSAAFKEIAQKLSAVRLSK